MPFFGSKNRSTATLSGTKNRLPNPKTGLEEPRVLGITWLGLKAADVMAEAAFMERTLGLKHLEEGNSLSGHHIRYDCGPLELELVSGGTVWASRPKPRQGQPDVPLIPSFQVDNIKHLAAQLNEREVLMTRLFEQGWAASFFFFDAERNIWQASETRTEPAVATEEAARIGALWLAAEDFPAQVAFYRDVLGLPLVAQPDNPAPITLEAELYQQENPLITLDNPPVEDAAGVQPETPRPLEAVFFAQGVRLALSPGGRRLENGAERVWGQDTAFLPGFQTNNLPGLVARLQAAGVKTSSPFPHYRTPSRLDPRQPQTTQAIRFSDPEGNPWQVFE
jgi:catechol 2,3-dioxygenase-like lactoylglutathione lyase family enzyme